MSGTGPLRTTRAPALPSPPRGVTIAAYPTYEQAQRAVDHLSDQHFPVQMVTIVGVDLQMVERVTGRLTWSRVALAGLASGAWFGLFVGLLLSLFASTEQQQFSWLAAVLIGAAFGMLFGLISYAFTGGRRDFTSTSQIVAGEYRVLCLEEQAGAAGRLLAGLDGGVGSLRSGAGLPPAGGAAAPVAEPPAQPSLTGPTYGEMIARKRQEEEAQRGSGTP